MERKRKRRLPGAAAALAAAALLLTTGASSGAAVSSPPAEAAEPALYKAVPAAGMDGMTAAGKGKAVPGAAAEPEGPPCPVPETEAVEDTYFERAIFLGDSRTQGLFLYSGLSSGYEYTAVGATVESVFTKNVWPADGKEKVPLLDALAEAECGKVYLMLGVNELGWSKKETFHDQYAKVIDRVREDHPEAEIVLQTILPVSAKQDAKGSYVNNARIGVYNQVIRALAEEKDCALVDVAEALAGEDGCLPKELNFDGVHLNPAGCKIWLDYLRTHSLSKKNF